MAASITYNVSGDSAPDAKFIKYKKHCIKCQAEHVFVISEREYTEWKVNKTYIQTVFPHLDIDTRELMVSGTCVECFKQMYP